MLDPIKSSFKLIRKPNLGPRPSRIGLISILTICILGIFASGLVAINARESYIQSHSERTRSIVEALPFNEIDNLTGEASDAKLPDYPVIKQRLKRIKMANDDIRLAHITTFRDNNIYFAVDSEDSNTRDYSKPGKLYENPSIGLYQAFQYQVNFFEGPRKDLWGSWMASEAPIFNPETGDFIGMLGIESPTTRYYIEVLSRVLVPILIALTASLLLWKIDHVRRKHEEILRLKNQFVSIASHELRSPLTGMHWAIESLLNNKSTTAKQAVVLNDMLRSTEGSMTTVNEILDLSVFERTKPAKLSVVPMDLNIVTRDVIRNLKLSAEEKKIEINTKGLSHHAPMQGDPGAIKRALSNILSNSIKYSAEGSAIRINYRQHGKTHDITIADKGIGVPKRDQRKVLSGYYRSKNAIKSQSAGTGLGLYVSRLIVEQHHGSLKLVSVENHGTTITITLPRSHDSVSTKAASSS